MNGWWTTTMAHCYSAHFHNNFICSDSLKSNIEGKDMLENRSFWSGMRLFVASAFRISFVHAFAVGCRFASFSAAFDKFLFKQLMNKYCGVSASFIKLQFNYSRAIIKLIFIIRLSSRIHLKYVIIYSLQLKLIAVCCVTWHTVYAVRCAYLNALNGF